VADGWGEARGQVISRKVIMTRLQRLKDETPPYTHEENLVPFHGDILLVLEDIREPEQTSSVTRRTLREHDNRTMCSFPHLLQAFVFLLVVGGLGRDPSSVGDHGPE
jgi:hypothetical protein